MSTSNITRELRLVLVNAGSGLQETPNLRISAERLRKKLVGIIPDYMCGPSCESAQTVASIISGRRTLDLFTHADFHAPRKQEESARLKRLLTDMQSAVLSEYLHHPHHGLLLDFARQVLFRIRDCASHAKWDHIKDAKLAEYCRAAPTVIYVGYPPTLSAIGYVAFEQHAEIRALCLEARLDCCHALDLGYGACTPAAKRAAIWIRAED